MTGKLAAAYYRVSTSNQDLDSQRIKVRDYATKEGYTLVKEFEDFAISGADPYRPSFLELQEWIKASPGSTVLTSDLDRLGRDMFIYLQLKDLCKKSSVTLHPIGINKTGNIEIDNLMENILASFAEYQKYDIKSKMMRGKISELKKGNPIVSGAPYGYTYHKVDGNGQARIEINEDEAVVVRRIYDMYLNKDMSIRNIAITLTSEKVPTKKGGKLWVRSHIGRILTSEKYMGIYNFGKYKVIDSLARKTVKRNKEDYIVLQIPAIIDKETFAAVQQKIERNNQFAYPKNAKHDYLLSGLLFCDVCGGRYGGMYKTYGQRFYRCNSRDKYDENGNSLHCRNYAFKSEPLEIAVWKDILKVLFSPSQYISKWKKTVEQNISKIDETVDRTYYLIKKLKEIDQKESEFFTLFTTGKITLRDVETYKIRANQLRENYEKELRQKEYDLRTMRQMENLVPDITIKPDDVKQMKQLPFDEQLPIVRKYIRSVYVLPTKGKFRLLYTIPMKQRIVSIPLGKGRHGNKRLSVSTHAILSATITRHITIPGLEFRNLRQSLILLENLSKRNPITEVNMTPLS